MTERVPEGAVPDFGERSSALSAKTTPWRAGFFVIAGPCAIESRQHALETADAIAGISARTGVPIVYKSSFDKANRSSGASFRGVGMAAGLDILAAVRAATGLPVVTDVHGADQAAPVAEAVDMLQTPAFLCRQTDFIAAVAATGRPTNIKKGQFLSPWEMGNVIAKARAAAAEAGRPEDNFLACERGTSFGYGNLVVDMRGLSIMARACAAPIVFDATHSVQLPGAAGTSSGGERAHAPALARAAVATGAVTGVFMETHPDPDRAPCDGPNMIPLAEIEALIADLRAIHELVGRRAA